MVKINYIYKVLPSERNTCAQDLIILHPKGQCNIPQNRPSTHLNIAQNCLSVLKMKN